MKDKIVIDLTKIMDEMFDAAQSVKDSFEKGDFDFSNWEDKMRDFTGHNKDRGKGPFHDHGRGPGRRQNSGAWDDNMDFYPTYSYPPMNVYLSKEREMVFEFAMAGFDESSIDLQFLGDYMVFSAKIPEVKEDEEGDESVKYFKRRLKMKDIKEQQYYVPEDKFDREKVSARFRNGVLKVVIPAKEEFQTKEGVKIQILGEDD
ncbi:Hsp20/alpha crystallin family protein [Spirochaeta cellobiosiphila]|uniref:Hsp20/alpha crystallin family protein n=1 Tax=Spirochaeta cellobiosiphila TaxID=504483 RepID=UPI0003FDE3F2|nr:Hsp20 family protein [Spirochaeta cellobiosiphila]